MPVWHAVLLGAVQGLTEFLPVSSTAHLLAVRHWLGHPHPDDAFTVVVQMGTLAAVYGYFRRDIAALARAVWADLALLEVGSTPAGKLGWLILAGSVPAGVAGLLLKKWLKTHFYTLPAMGVVAIVFALLMLAAEWWGRRRPGRGEDGITVADAVSIGGWQALALMPGGSRSGATITGGLFVGLTREAATRFSFLLSLPIITAAGLKELYDEYKKLKVPAPDGVPSLFASGDQVLTLLVGTAVAGAVGYLAIAGLLAFLRQYSTGVIVAYRVAFGVTLILASGGRKPPGAVVGEEPAVPGQAAPGGLRPPLAPAADRCDVRGRVVWPPRREVPAPQPITDIQWPGVPPGTVYEDLRVDPATRGVRDAVVWLTDDPVNRTGVPLRDGLTAPAPVAHTLTAGRVQFAPRVLAVRAGDTVTVAQAGTAHRISIDDAERAATGPLEFTRRPVAVTAEPFGWMKAWVWAFDTPYFAVTGPDGGFVVRGVPPGARRLVVWHEQGYHGERVAGLPLTVPAAATVEAPVVELEVR